MPAEIDSWRPRDLAALLALDGDELRAGYRDGRDRDSPEPGPNRSPSYRHGWRCGAVDAGRIAMDAHDRTLARAVLDHPGVLAGEGR